MNNFYKNIIDEIKEKKVLNDELESELNKAITVFKKEQEIKNK